MNKYYIPPMKYQNLIFALSMLALFLALLASMQYQPINQQEAAAGLMMCAGCGL